MMPKVLIIRTAGINCDKETEFAFQSAGAQTDLVHISSLKEKKNLSDYRIMCIPGGFSYGDDLGAGKILSQEFLLWFKDHLERFIKDGGLILGICNGFQVLVKTGILPDIDFQQKVTLTFNDSGRFEARWVYLKVSGRSLWFKNLPEVIRLPVAHGEGKFYAEKPVLERIEAQTQVAMRYCDENGNKKEYPYNPNGSLNSIAGITDSTGRILGLMPHPERCVFKHHFPFWHDESNEVYGLKIFENAVKYCK